MTNLTEWATAERTTKERRGVDMVSKKITVFKCLGSQKGSRKEKEVTKMRKAKKVNEKDKKQELE